MISNYVTIDRVIEKVNRFKIPGGYWNLEEIKEWTYDVLEKINDQTARVKAIVQIEIVDDKGKIPAYVETIISVYDDYTGDKLENILPYKTLNNNTYILNGGFIYTDLKEGTGKGRLTINYLTVPTDEDGNPFIPDNNYYISAVEKYILFKIGERAYWSGKILERQLLMLEQEWLFYLPAAQASQKMDLIHDPKRFARIHNRK
jgi:hypothetical protein